MRRRLALQPRAQFPGQQVHHGVGEIAGGKILQRSLVVQRRRQPIVAARCERGIGQIGPILAFRLAQEHHAVAPLLQRLRPRQFVEAAGDQPVRKNLRGLRRRRQRHRRLRQRDGMQGALASRAQRHRAAIEGDFFCAFDLVGQMMLDLLLGDRGGQQDAAARRGASQLADGDVRCAGERRGLLDGGAAAVRQHKAAVAAVAGDTVGEGKGQHHAGGEIALAFRLLRRRHLLRPASREVAGTARTRRTVAAELIQPCIEIGAVAAKAALGEDSGNRCGLFT